MELMCTGQVECKWAVKSMQLLNRRVNIQPVARIVTVHQVRCLVERASRVSRFKTFRGEHPSNSHNSPPTINTRKAIPIMARSLRRSAFETEGLSKNSGCFAAFSRSEFSMKYGRRPAVASRYTYPGI